MTLPKPIPAAVPKAPLHAELSMSALGGSDTGQLGDQGWALPLMGSITSAFGPRPNQPVDGVELFHKGIDLAAPCGTNVAAAAGGTIVYASPSGTFGQFIVVDHGDGIQTTYAHNSVIRVSVGQSVAAGEVIAAVGNTGASTGCHLDFRTLADGTALDPQPFMSARGITLG